MKITVEKNTEWSLVLDAARWTVNKPELNKEPSENFKRKILISEHSPIRELRYTIKMEGIPNFSSQQISRHDNFAGHSHRTGSLDQSYVGTNRSSRKDVKSEDVNRLTPVDHRISLSAADFIELSKKRLCACASKETQKVWREVIRKLEEIEPQLAKVCQPTCIYRGFCPEKDSCGFAETDWFQECLTEYRKK